MHPIIVRLQPSSEQAPAVFAHGCDVVVVAGAGTGKTRTLVARMLHLLTTGMELRRIVAVTFTVKAAREMRNRLREEIQLFLAETNLSAADLLLWQEVDAALDAARIGTIHSLCTELLRNHPAEAAIDPRFDVLDETQAAMLRQDAIAEALGWAADDEQAVELFQFFAPAALQALLSQLLGNPQVAAALLSKSHWSTWAQTVGDVLRQRFLFDPGVQGALAIVQGLQRQETITAAQERGDDLAGDLLQLLPLCAQLVQSAPYDDLTDLVAGLTQLRGLLKGNRGRAALWKPTIPPKEEVKYLREQYDKRLAPLLKGVNPTLDGQLAQGLPQLQRLFDVARRRYQAAKRERGMLDFEDLEQGALDLLQNHSGVRSRWQQEVGALLVDEFQDTNERQRDLVRLLNGEGGNRDTLAEKERAWAGGRLFLVGDAKQSIYRFRGADVQVFRSEQERLRSGAGQSFDLAVSYRTHAALLAGLNHLLAAVLGSEDDPQRPWRAPFQPLQASRATCDFGLSAPYIEVQMAAGSKGSGSLQRAATALAERLAQLVSDSAQAQGGLTYGHIAILCRSYRGFGSYEDALEAAGIPYMTVAGRGFYARAEIRDLLNALAALSDPNDDLALAGLLRSPAIGLSDVELFNLRCTEDSGVRPLWPALQAAEDATSRRAAALIAELHSEAGRIGVADLLKRLLDATDYSARLLLAGEVRAARNVAKLLDDAHRSGLVSTGAFLASVQHMRDVGGREGEARSDDAGSVQIMTVHQAKGLQFPVVVIGDAAGSGGGRAGAVLFDPHLGVTPTLTDAEGERPLVCRLAATTEQEMAEAESDRLLYVAATRAADKLILNGHVRVAANGALRGDGWLGQVLAELGIDQAPSTYTEEGDGTHHLDARLNAEAVRCSLYEPRFGGETPAATVVRAESSRGEEANTFTPELIGPLPAAMAAPRDDERRVWRVAPAADQRYAPAWIIGRLVHETIAGWRLPLDGSFAEWTAARCHDFGLADRARILDAEQRARRYLERLQTSAIFRQIAQADQRLHELPYSYLANGQSESGIIDLLYRRGDAWTIVDFKTDRIRTPAEREEIIRHKGYDAQLARYVSAVEALLGQRPAALLCLIDDVGQVCTGPTP